jgi:hypothetical protein
MQIELRPHPAQARWHNPKTGRDEPLWYDDEKTQPVPLITDQKSIYLEGVMVGYCGVNPDSPVCLTQHVPDAVRDAIEEYVAAEIGKPSGIAMPPPPEAVEREIRDMLDEDEDFSDDTDPLDED